MQSHEIDYQVYGDDLQFVEVELDPRETVIAEAGAMMYMDDGIVFETRMGDGSRPQGMMDKVLSVGKRMLTGESLFMTHFTNVSEGKRRLAFAAPYPGKIIAIDLDEARGELICQKDAFLGGPGHGNQHCLQQEARRGLLWRRGFYPPAAAGRWDGLYPRGRHDCREAPGRAEAVGGHRLPRGV